MRLPRHSRARTTVSDLQSLRSAQITPGEAAQAQISKFAVVGAVADSIGSALETVKEVQQETQNAQDEIIFQTGESNLKAAFTNLDNDPNLKKTEQDDGTPTPEYYRREADAIIKTYKEHLDKITGPEAKQRAGFLAHNKEVELRAEIRGQVGVIETRVAEGELYKGFTSALRNNDIEGAKAMIVLGTSRMLLSPEAAERWTVAAEKAETQNAATELIQDVDEGYAISQEEGDRRLSELIKNPDIDPQTKNMAVDGSEEKKVEWAKARDAETKAEEVTAILSFGNDTASADAGLMSYEQADAAFAAGRYGDADSVGAANRRNGLFKTITSALKRTETEIDIRKTFENGQFMLDDKEHRDALSVYENEVTSQMEGPARIQTIGDISRTLGTVSTQTSNVLSLSGKSEAALAANLPLYRELVSDDSVMPALHLTGSAESALEDASVLMDAGVGQAKAATIAWDNQHISELEKTDREQSWKDAAVESANDSFQELLDSDHYEEPGFGDVDDPPTMMAVEYGAAYKAVYMQTGNEQTAMNIATRATKRNWVMTNFNSANPKEFTVEKNGIPGDSHRIRASIIREFEGVSLKTRHPDGTYKTTKINADDVTFEALETIDGVRRWGVMQNDVPLIRVSDDGIETATFTLDDSRVFEFQKKAAAKEATEQRLKDIKNEVSRLEGLPEENPYMNVFPSFVASRRQRVKSLGKEKARLEKELPKLDIKF